MDELDTAMLATVSGGAINPLPALNMAWKVFKSPTKITLFHGRGSVPVPAALGYWTGVAARAVGIGAVGGLAGHAFDEATTPVR